MLSFLATAARLSHSPVEAEFKEVHRCFQGTASRYDGPAAPSISKAVLHMSCSSICSKMMEWGSETGMFWFTSAFSLWGCFGGCCISRMSRTLSKWVWRLLTCSGWHVLLSCSNQPECCMLSPFFSSWVWRILVSWSVGEIWPLYSLVSQLGWFVLQPVN